MACRRPPVVLSFLLLVALQWIATTRCAAQSREVAVTMAATVSPNGRQLSFCGANLCNPPTRPLIIYAGYATGGSFAFPLMHVRRLPLYIDLPVLYVSPRSFHNRSLPTFTSIFVTPSVQIKWREDRLVAPFASLGGGIAHFGSTNPYGPGSASNTTGAVQFGGGAYLKTFVPQLYLRGEFHDVITGRPETERLFLGPNVVGPRQNNFIIGGSLVFKF